MFEEIEIKKFFELSSKIPSGQFIVLVVYRFYEMITISMSFTSKIVNSHLTVTGEERLLYKPF